MKAKEAAKRSQASTAALTLYLQQCAVFSRYFSIPWTEVRFAPAPSEMRLNGRWAHSRSIPEPVEVLLPPDARLRGGRCFLGFDAAIGLDAAAVHHLAVTGQRGFRLGINERSAT